MMDWPLVVVDWVNSLRLGKNRLGRMEDLGDGEFFREILKILFNKTVNSRTEVFEALEESLRGFYTPKDWINFGGAEEGDGDELMKIVSVLIGWSSLESEEKMFQENPSTYLSVEAQVLLTRFLAAVLENGKVVDKSFIMAGVEEEETEDKPDAEEADIKSLQESLSVMLEEHQHQLTEKEHEISTLKNRIEVLTACQSDLMDEINSYKDDFSRFRTRIEDLKKENHSLQINSNPSLVMGTPENSCGTPEEKRKATTALREKLKVSENYVELLESRLDQSNSKVGELEGALKGLQETIQAAYLREEELISELKKEGQEKEGLLAEIDARNEILRKLEQEVQDYKDSQIMHHINEESGIFMEASVCNGTQTSLSFSSNSSIDDCDNKAGEDLAAELHRQSSQINILESQIQQNCDISTDGRRKIKSSESFGFGIILPIIVAIVAWLIVAFPWTGSSLILELLLGRQELSYVVEKYGRLEHLSPPVI